MSRFDVNFNCPVSQEPILFESLYMVNMHTQYLHMHAHLSSVFTLATSWFLEAHFLLGLSMSF